MRWRLATAVVMAVCAGVAVVGTAQGQAHAGLFNLEVPFNGKATIVENDPDGQLWRASVLCYGARAQESDALGALGHLEADLGPRLTLYGEAAVPLAHETNVRPLAGELGVALHLKFADVQGKLSLTSGFLHRRSLLVPNGARGLLGVHGGVIFQRAAVVPRDAQPDADVVATSSAMVAVGLHVGGRQHLVVDLDDPDMSEAGRRSSTIAYRIYIDAIARLSTSSDSDRPGAPTPIGAHAWGGRFGIDYVYRPGALGLGAKLELAYYPKPGRGWSGLAAIGLGFGH